MLDEVGVDDGVEEVVVDRVVYVCILVVVAPARFSIDHHLRRWVDLPASSIREKEGIVCAASRFEAILVLARHERAMEHGAVLSHTR